MDAGILAHYHHADAGILAQYYRVDAGILAQYYRVDAGTLALSHLGEEMAREEVEMLVADVRTAIVFINYEKLVFVVLNG